MNQDTTKDLASKLLPCPFCGGKAEFGNNGSSEYIQCKLCKARTEFDFKFQSGQKGRAWPRWQARVHLESGAEGMKSAEEWCKEIFDDGGATNNVHRIEWLKQICAIQQDALKAATKSGNDHINKEK